MFVDAVKREDFFVICYRMFRAKFIFVNTKNAQYYNVHNFSFQTAKGTKGHALRFLTHLEEYADFPLQTW